MHRPDIVAAALGIAVSVRPATPYGGTLGSFETWTRLVRDPILHIMKEVPSLDLCDPLDLFVDAMNDAVDDETHKTFLEKLFEQVGAADFAADDARLAILANEELRDLVIEISASDPVMTNRSVAAILGKLRGLTLNGVRFTSKKRAGSNLWRIEGVG